VAFMGAGALGVPADRWEPGDASEAGQLAAWVRRFFRLACDEIDPLYGALAIETQLPSPSALSRANAGLRNVYVANRVFGADDRLHDDLRALYETGDVAWWRGGQYFSSWGPFNDTGRTFRYDPNALGQQTALLLDSALGSLPLERR
jgi:hypothetical protein